MAIFHMHVKVISRAKGGRTSTGAAAYRAGEKIYDVATGLTHDYTRKSGIVHAEIVLPAGAPDRLRDRATLWNEVEASEKRVNSRVAREIEVALPTELSTDQQIALVREYAAIFAADGMCADVCIHHKHDENPHCHIMLTTREIDPKTGEIGQKRRDWNDQKKLEGWREAWATLTNAALERAGRPERIDHRTLEAQGIDRRPTIHTGRNPMKIAANNAIKEQNAKLAEIDAQLAELAEEAANPQPLIEELKDTERCMRYNQAVIDYREEMIGDIAKRELVQADRDHQKTIDAIKEEREAIAEQIRELTDEEYEGYDPPWKYKYKGTLGKLLGFTEVDEEEVKRQTEELQKRDEELERRYEAAPKENEAKKAEIISRATQQHDAENPNDKQDVEEAHKLLIAQTARHKELKARRDAELKAQQEKEQREREEKERQRIEAEQRAKEARRKAEEERRKNMTTEEMKKEISDYITRKNAYIMQEDSKLTMDQLAFRRERSIKAAAEFDAQHEEEAASIAAMRKIVAEREPKKPVRRRSRDDFER